MLDESSTPFSVNNVIDVFIKSEPDEIDSKVLIDWKLFTVCQVPCKRLVVRKTRTALDVSFSEFPVEEDRRRELDTCYCCSICQTIFTNIVNLNVHFAVQHPKKVYLKYCPDQSILLNKHIAKKYKLQSEKRTSKYYEKDEKARCCRFCKKIINSSGDLLKHIRAVHFKYRPYLCTVCKKGFSCRGNLKKHEETHQIVRERPYKCGLCVQSFSRQEHLKRHLNIHRGIKRHKCTFCGRKFSHPWALTLHERAHMNYRPFTCGECGYKCITSSDLKKHKVTHTKEKAFNCLLCHQTFSYGSGLRAHMRRHDNEFISCEFCSKKLRNKNVLKKHLFLFHQGYTPYHCEKCKIYFDDRQQFDFHHEIHVSLKKYRCDFCGGGWDSRGDFLKHMSIHLKAKQYPCLFCDRAFVRPGRRQEHVAKMHSVLDAVAEIGLQIKIETEPDV